MSLNKIITLPFILIIRIYQYGISPLLGANCRFHPSCSQYGIEALQKHGIIKGLRFTAKRLSKCHPWGASGIDPVP